MYKDKFSILTNPPTEIRDYKNPFHIDNETISDSSILLAKAWVDSCNMRHPRCQNFGTKRQPTRLINVGTTLAPLAYLTRIAQSMHPEMWISCWALENGSSKSPFMAHRESRHGNPTRVIYRTFMVVGFNNRARFIFGCPKSHATICHSPSMRNHPKPWGEIRQSLQWIRSTAGAINTSKLPRVRKKVEYLHRRDRFPQCLFSAADYGTWIDCPVVLVYRCVPETWAWQVWAGLSIWLRSWCYWK